MPGQAPRRGTCLGESDQSARLKVAGNFDGGGGRGGTPRAQRGFDRWELPDRLGFGGLDDAPMVTTAWYGLAPTLVSADSMSASAPSNTTVATSETSASVGRGWVIIDSSVWVAMITGLPASRAR